MPDHNKTIVMSAEVLNKLPTGTLNELVGAMQEQSEMRNLTMRQDANSKKSLELTTRLLTVGILQAMS